MKYVITSVALGAAATALAIEPGSIVYLLIVIAGALIQVAVPHNDQKS